MSWEVVALVAALTVFAVSMAAGAWSAGRRHTMEDAGEWTFTTGTLGWFDRDDDGATWFALGEPPETEEELTAVRATRESTTRGEG